MSRRARASSSGTIPANLVSAAAVAGGGTGSPTPGSPQSSSPQSSSPVPPSSGPGSGSGSPVPPASAQRQSELWGDPSPAFPVGAQGVGTRVQVHPVVILTILEQWMRRPSDNSRMIGALLGSGSPGGLLDVRACFHIPFSEEQDQVLFFFFFYFLSLSRFNPHSFFLF